jgi:heme exporter protein C
MIHSREATLFFLRLSFFLFILAIYSCIWVAPTDFQQGENYRIIFIHVPAAWMSIFIYILISLASFLFLITKHPLLNIFSRIGTQFGILFTLLTIFTGSLWGKPMWGTFWVWDARLTSVFILLFIYLAATRLLDLSAEIGSIFICIGLINIPIIKFSVNWWNTLHQPSSITQFGTSIHISMMLPILVVFLGFITLFLFFISVRIRQYILNSYICSLKKKDFLIKSYNIKKAKKNFAATPSGPTSALT